MRDFHTGQHRRTLVIAGNRDDLIPGHELLDRGTGLLRQSLRVFNDEFDLPAIHTTGVVEDLGSDLETILHLGTLHDRTRRRLRDGHTDLDRIGGLRSAKRKRCGCNRQRETQHIAAQ